MRELRALRMSTACSRMCEPGTPAAITHLGSVYWYWYNIRVQHMYWYWSIYACIILLLQLQ